MRIYDPRLGKFLSVDPITADYAELTPYQFASNTPIQAIDQDGLEAAGVGFGISPNNMNAQNSELIGKTMIGVGKGFFKSLWSSIKSLATMSSPVLTPAKMQQTAAMAQAITHPKETFNNTKAGIKQWGRNLMSKDPDVAGQAFGSGLEFTAEMLIPVKGIQGLRAEKLGTLSEKVVTRTLDDLSSLKGATWEEAENLIPKDWVKGPLKKGAGIKFINPAKRGEQILLEKGVPGAKDPLHAGPYIKISRNGIKERVPLAGNPTIKP